MESDTYNTADSVVRQEDEVAREIKHMLHTYMLPLVHETLLIGVSGATDRRTVLPSDCFKNLNDGPPNVGPF